MTSPVQIRRVDSFDTAEHNLWWQTYAEAKRADMGENALIWTLEGYAIRSWIGPVPDEIVAEWAALDAVLDTEAPTGELDIEAASADVADYRADEQMQAMQGRTSFGTVALTSDGRVAAYTRLAVSGDA